MNIFVNGKPQTIDGGTTLTTLLGSLKLDPQRVAVERNLAVVARETFDKTVLADGDTLEIVQFVGGG